MEALLKIHAQKAEIGKVSHKVLKHFVHEFHAPQKTAQMEAALREMENWASLTGDMEEVFASGDVDAMAQRLNAVQTSVQVRRSFATLLDGFSC